jgi:uncharacterized membrane protein
MKRALIAVLIAAAGFVWFTSGELPPVMASHFGLGGEANGFSGRGTYTVVMLIMVVAVPLTVASTASLVRGLPNELINLPNREYWLAPERRAATLESLSTWSTAFALAVALFLCYVHWLVVRSNAAQPARLSEIPVFVGMGAFGVVTLLWIFLLFRRFGRVH